ncbi:hypothetical protein [Nocardia sp. alder85J]|uniref:hypothetical protein n=1 Tax=Nocardia sp. alder85J TaxID=2862949 RepID=UPI001CD34B20|nr:hypothetical protein [Nocardia sp. alder85J]MCX4094479.1 hypothetical protein [Nocardia sp. alder85J]
MPRSTSEQLVRLADDLGLDGIELFDAVHDAASNTASQINNNGLTAQIEYLNEQFGAAETEQLIREAADTGQ